jgi:hypothetical protein
VRADIKQTIIDLLRRKGEQTTEEIQAAIAASGLPKSNHRYSTVRKYYLEPLASHGVLKLVRESNPGGGVWSLR